MSRSHFHHRLADTALELNGFLALALIGLPGFIVGGQLLTWLRYGYWNKRPLNEMLIRNDLYPWTDWAGIQSIVDWFLGMPLSLAAALLVIAVMLVNVWFGVSMRERGDRLWKEEKAETDAAP